MQAKIINENFANIALRTKLLNVRDGQTTVCQDENLFTNKNQYPVSQKLTKLGCVSWPLFSVWLSIPWLAGSMTNAWVPNLWYMYHLWYITVAIVRWYIWRHEEIRNFFNNTIKTKYIKLNEKSFAPTCHQL